MQFHLLSLIPDVMKPYLSESILGRALQKGLIQIDYHQLRDYAQNKHQSVDDRPYGGGPGMVLRPDVVVDAIRSLKAKHPIDRVILTSPRGKRFNHRVAARLTQYSSLLIISGRYEGIDQRAIDSEIDEEISIGDYVLTGGELPTQVIVDAVSRLLPEVVGDQEGPKQDSFAKGLLEHPHYTRPAIFEEKSVPEVLLEGNHQKIDQWRQEESLRVTLERRPDIAVPLYIALVHYPVVNKRGDLVTTSITNFDLHDLARTATTFGVTTCFIVTPNLAQQNMAAFIKKYWQEGHGAEYNPDRAQAFEALEISQSLKDCCLTIEKRHGKPPILIGTTAKHAEKPININGLTEMIRELKAPLLLVFGTGWGLASSLFEKLQGTLEPIHGPGEYNHLPVRAAVAIYLDRLYRSMIKE